MESMNSILGFSLFDMENAAVATHLGIGALISRGSFWTWLFKFAVFLYSIDKLVKFAIESYKVKGKNLIRPFVSLIVAVSVIISTVFLVGCSMKTDQYASHTNTVINDTGEYESTSQIVDDDSLTISSVSEGIEYTSSTGLSPANGFISSSDVKQGGDTVRSNSKTTIDVSYSFDVVKPGQDVDLRTYLNKPNAIKVSERRREVVSLSLNKPKTIQFGRFVCGVETASLRNYKSTICDKAKGSRFFSSNLQCRVMKPELLLNRVTKVCLSESKRLAFVDGTSQHENKNSNSLLVRGFSKLSKFKNKILKNESIHDSAVVTLCSRKGKPSKFVLNLNTLIKKRSSCIGLIKANPMLWINPFSSSRKFATHKN